MSEPSATTSYRSMVAAVLAAIGASTCCAGPLLLLTLGISGSWIGYLSNFEPYRPFFIGVTLVFIGLAFRKLYLVPQSCTVDAPCATPSFQSKQRITFWVLSIAAVAILSFPWYAPFILE